jgi:hypothetical protein
MVSFFCLHRRCTAFVLLSSLWVFSHAQEAPTTPSALPSVTVAALKSPLEFPYRRAYDATTKVLVASGGLVDLVFKLHDKAVNATNKLRLTVEYGEQVTDIPLDGNNSFTLIPDADAAAQSAQLVVNRHSKEVGVEVDMQPNVKAFKGEKLTVADMDRLIQAGRAARSSLLPWYARVVTPTVNSVRICSTQTSARFALRGEGGAEAPLNSKSALDVLGRAASCIDFNGDRDDYAASSVVIVPDGSTFDYEGSLF